MIAVLAFVVALGCGHKGPPVPPPLRNPTASTDLAVQQRGVEFVLTFAYPQTTVSGTPLEPLERIEVWELVRPVPEWTPPVTVSEGDEDPEPADSQLDEPPEEEAPDFFESSSGAGDDPSRRDPPASIASTEDPSARVLADEEGAPPEPEDDDLDGEESSLGDSESEEPIVEVPTKEELLAVESVEFSALAELRVVFQNEAVDALSVGDKMIITLPIDPQAGENQSSDDEQAIETGSIFAIKTGVTEKLMSGFSNTVAIAHRTPPAPPSGFRLEPDQDKVAIRWESIGDASEDLVAYHVHRRDAQVPRYGLPVALVPIVDPPESEETEDADTTSLPDRGYEYFDRSAVLGQRYIYALTTVSNRMPLVESAITVEQELDYQDRFAPPRPGNLIALAESGRIRLLWEAPRAPDIAGYFVERKSNREEFSRIQTEPVQGLEFSDREISSGREYSYRVVAVDRSGNESTPSQTVDVRAP